MGKKGYLEVVCGSMFSGKSEELIRRIKRAKIANKNVQLFKPEIDNRYSDNKVITHDGQFQLEATVVKDSSDLLSKVDPNVEVVGIDEVQFFDNDIINTIETLNKNGVKVIAAGLDMYSSGEVFGPIGTLMAKAKYVTKLHAVCVLCGNDGYFSRSIGDNELTNKKSTIIVGSFGKYIAVCENCKDKDLN